MSHTKTIVSALFVAVAVALAPAAAVLAQGEKQLTLDELLAKVKEGWRYVENETISSAGGLTSGIDLALRVVERYFGSEVAARTASYMEYESEGWRLEQAARQLAREFSSH